MFGLYFKCLLGWVSDVGLNQEGHGFGSQSKSSSGLCSKLGLDGPVLGLDPDLTPKRANQLEKDVEPLAGCGLAQEDGRMCLSKGSPSAFGPFLSPCPEGFIQKEGTLALMSPSTTNVGDMGLGKIQGKMGHENVESFSEKGLEKAESRYEGAFRPLPSSVFFFGWVPPVRGSVCQGGDVLSEYVITPQPLVPVECGGVLCTQEEIHVTWS